MIFFQRRETEKITIFSSLNLNYSINIPTFPVPNSPNMKTALVIQEDIIILKILERLMKVNAYDCKAIRSLYDLNIEDQNIDYDIIISDILFDGIAPLDFIFQIGEVLLHRSLVIVTNMGQERIEKDMLASKNVAGFFAVPFDVNNITKLIAGCS